jgi:hypothetical protein
MNEIAAERKRKKRKPRVSASLEGERLVIGELLRRGFEAQLANLSSGTHGLLVRIGDLPPKLIRVRTVHSTPWYVRGASFAGSPADQVTVYVLLGVERGAKSVRFFVVKNSDLAAQFRQPSNWKAFGFIDAKTVEKYENNWDILR